MSDADSVELDAIPDEIDWSMMFGSISILNPATERERAAKMADDARLWRRACDEVGLETWTVPLGAPCSIDGCNRPVGGRGLCAAHIYREKVGLPLDASVRFRNKGSKGGTPCSVEGCSKRRERASGLCSTHNYRQEAGLPLDAPTFRPRNDPTCSVDGCHRASRAHNMCSAHHDRWRAGAPLDTPIRVFGRTCSVENCDAKASVKGICTKHYKRLKRTGSLMERVSLKRICSIDGCGGAHRSLGFCGKHYLNYNRTGSAVRPGNNEQ